MFLNCGVGEDSWQSLGLQGDQTSLSYRKSTLNIHQKDWCWAEAPILWPPDAKSWLTGKDPDAGKDWGQEKRATEVEMVRQHHQLNGHEFEQTLGDSEAQGSLARCSPWSGKELDMTWQLNNKWVLWKLQRAMFYILFESLFFWKNCYTSSNWVSLAVWAFL